MSSRLWLPLLLLAACRPEARSRRSTKPPADTGSLAAMLRERHPARGRTLHTPRVVAEPSVVVFWLEGDTTNADSAAAVADDLDYYTGRIAATLRANGIALVPTNADTVYVEQPDGRRRPIVLSGLDYAYGYLLVDPGSPERILTGVYRDDELRDELDAYFDLSDDSDSTKMPRRITTD